MKNLFFVFCGFLTLLGYSQNTLNDYQKVLIPAKFSFQKEANQYRINTTIKSYLKQKGFEVYLDNEDIPEGFIDYNCNKLFVNASEQNSLFVTRIKIEFKDCKGTILFATDIGESKEKDFATAYNLATIQALKSFEKAKYKFSGKSYDDDEVEEKLKEREVESVSVTQVNVEKNELFIKVVDKLSHSELILYKTSKAELYLTTFNGNQGVVFSKSGVWYVEYLQNGKVVSKKLEIKF